MFELRLIEFPKQIGERLERVVQKHGGGKLDHEGRLALLGQVAGGQPQVIARYAEEHAAHNALAEVVLLGARGEVVKAAT
jgi:hypothetical protein